MTVQGAAEEIFFIGIKNTAKIKFSIRQILANKLWWRPSSLSVNNVVLYQLVELFQYLVVTFYWLKDDKEGECAWLETEVYRYKQTDKAFITGP